MRILLLSLVLLMFGFPAFGQKTLEEEIQQQLDEYNKSSVSVAQDILEKYINDQVMGTILEKQTGSPIRLVRPDDANMAILTAPFEECTYSMKKSMRLHQNSILEVRLIEYGIKENPSNLNSTEYFISVMFHESVPNALVSICLKNKTTTPSTTFIVFNTAIEGMIIQTYKNRYKI